MFAYCLNNPVNYADPTGMCVARELMNDPMYSFACDDRGSGAGQGGGSIPLVYPLASLADVLGSAVDSFDEWLEDQRRAVADKVSKSLAKSTTRQSDDQVHIHHIVPQKDTRGLPAYIIVEKVFPDYGVDDPRNLMPVSARIHSRLHTNLYYFLVNNTITIAYIFAGDDAVRRVANVEAALNGLRAFIHTLELL